MTFTNVYASGLVVIVVSINGGHSTPKHDYLGLSDTEHVYRSSEHKGSDPKYNGHQYVQDLRGFRTKALSHRAGEERYFFV